MRMRGEYNKYYEVEINPVNLDQCSLTGFASALTVHDGGDITGQCLVFSLNHQVRYIIFYMI